MSKVADRIRRGLEQAVAYAEGAANAPMCRVHDSPRARTPAGRSPEKVSR